VTVPLAAEDQIVAALRRIMHAVELHSRRLVERVGLTGPQLAVLSMAAKVGPRPTGELARLVHLSQPTVTGILDRMERRGLVQRVRAQQDRRTVNISVTDAGRELLERAPSLLQNQFRQELEKLRDWELTLMLSTLQRIAGMMEADELGASELASILSAEPGAVAGPPASDGETPPS
jgi:DNA-binding MarR family transcriptional regulator